jgi:hypothetical protein
MEEMDQLWPLRCRDRLVELKDVGSDGAQICGRQQNFVADDLATNLVTKFYGRPQNKSPNFTKNRKLMLLQLMVRSTDPQRFSLHFS